MLIKLTTSGKTYNITNRDLLSCKYSQDASDNNEIIMGFASATGLNFTVRNLNGKYDDALFSDSTCELWSDDGGIKRGVFRVKKVTRQHESLVFETVDYMTNLDQKYDEVTFPITVADFIDKICQQCDLEHERLDLLPNSLKVLRNPDPYVGKNCREILQLLCEYIGCFAIMNHDNKLELKWYNFAFPSRAFTYSELHEFSIDETESNITGLQIYVDNLKYESGTGEYSLFLSEDNPAYCEDTSSIDELLENITNRLLTRMNYYGGQIKVRADYTLNVGDVIFVNDKKGIKRTMIITNIEFNNDSNMVITSAGQNRDRNFASTSQTDKGRGQTVKMVKIKNEDRLVVTPETEQVINEFDLKNVNETTQVYLGYSGIYDIKGNTNIEIEVHINGENTQTFYYGLNTGKTTITFNLQLDLNLEEETNTVEIYLKTSGAEIDISAEDSICNLIIINANVETHKAEDLEIKVEDEIYGIPYVKVYRYPGMWTDFTM